MQLSLFDLIRRAKPAPGPVPGPGMGRPQRKPLIAPIQRTSQLKRVWVEVRRAWFPNRPDLDHYTVLWSRRPQKRTLASCNIETKRVIVARELNYPEHYCRLRPLLYHEMCHAYLGFSVVDKERRSRWHGKEFKALERRYPAMAEFDRWVINGGWEKAVRSDRAKRAYLRRKEQRSALSVWRRK